jgi:hypothetical protein
MLAKINKTNAQTIVSLICNQVSMSPAILLRRFGCIAPKTLNYLVFQFWILSVHDEGYSRNALCTLSLISTFWLPGNYMNDIYLDYHLWVCYIALGGGMLEYLYICSSTALNVSVGILWISNIIQRNQRRTAICHAKEILDKSVEEVGEIQFTIKKVIVKYNSSFPNAKTIRCIRHTCTTYVYFK